MAIFFFSVSGFGNISFSVAANSLVILCDCCFQSCLIAVIRPDFFSEQIINKNRVFERFFHEKIAVS